MKATGIVRRIDELGRVVIPKELRRTLRIREGDPMEIYTEQGGALVFRKYSPLGAWEELAEPLCRALWENTGFPAAICDRDRILAAAGPGQQSLTDRVLTRGLLRRLEAGEPCCAAGRGLPVPLAEGAEALLGASAPVLAGGDLLGGLLLGAEPERNRWPGDAELRLLKLLADFLRAHAEA